MRARSAALISRIAAFRSAGGGLPVRQRRQGVGGAGVGAVVMRSSFSEDSLLRGRRARRRLQARVLTRLVGMTPAKPSLDLLRSLTDEHVLRALMERARA